MRRCALSSYGGEHTTTNIQGEQTFEGENETMSHQVEGEHSQLPLNDQQEHHFEGEHQDEHHVEGEHDETETINLDENDEFHELNDIFSVAGFENKDMYEDAPLEFNPDFPQLEKWTRNHPKEQVIGNPQDGVLTRAQIRAKNEVLNVNQ